MADQDKTTGRKTGQKYTVPALDKGLDVIELLSKSAASMSQADIGRAMGRSASEIFRTLSALEARGYIRRTQGGQYRLTLKLFELSRTHSPYEELLRVAQPVMRDLSEEVGETCHLTTLREGEIVVLAQHESPKPLRLSIEVGSRHSPLATSSGRIILSAMGDDERLSFLRAYTEYFDLPKEVQDAFLVKVKNAQDCGYEISVGERFVGGLDVGVLIGSPKSKVKAALIVATLQSAHGPNLEQIREAALRAGRKITELVGID
ncbi:IclR family transcriptional regulator [Celeribacter sp.]|uniref:IclR family transcriptional regulator n=1 Tax=Celeribacter sp. TaxID=1890673 RepID=UPI003A8D9D34